MNEPTQSTSEAIALLKQYRMKLILQGRVIARRICNEEGTVHARRIYDEMKGEITREVGSYWLGPVFNKKEFEWTGQWHQVNEYSAATNFHGPVGIRVWRLRP